MFRKIIIASELSKNTFDIIKCLARLKELGAEECLILQCLDPEESDQKISSFVAEIYNTNLSTQKELLENQGFKVEARTITGEITQELNRIAEDENFSLIVIGPNEYNLTEKLFLSGSSQKIIHNTSKPVLLINTSPEDAEVPDYIKACNIKEHILFPTDFSDNAALAFEFVKKLVSYGVKKITIAHVQDESRIFPHLSHRIQEFNETDMKRLQKLKEELQSENDAEVSIKLLRGSPSAELLRLIHESQTPLVVMGSQGRGFVKELFVGSVSHNIVRNSMASVLLIPAKRL